MFSQFFVQIFALYKFFRKNLRKKGANFLWILYVSWRGEGGIAHMHMRLVMALLAAVAYFSQLALALHYTLCCPVSVNLEISTSLLREV